MPPLRGGLYERERTDGSCAGATPIREGAGPGPGSSPRSRAFRCGTGLSVRYRHGLNVHAGMATNIPLCAAGPHGQLLHRHPSGSARPRYLASGQLYLTDGAAGAIWQSCRSPVSSGPAGERRSELPTAYWPTSGVNTPLRIVACTIAGGLLCLAPPPAGISRGCSSVAAWALAAAAGEIFGPGLKHFRVRWIRLTWRKCDPWKRERIRGNGDGSSDSASSPRAEARCRPG